MQNQNRIELVSQMLLDQITKVSNSNGEDLKVEIEKAKVITSAAGQFANLEKTNLALEMYRNRNVPKSFRSEQIEDVQGIEENKPTLLEQSTQKKSTDQ